MKNWKRIIDYPEAEQHKLRWLLRHAPGNGIIDAGVALKFGREWRINEKKLPAFLRKLTLEALGNAA